MVLGRRQCIYDITIPTLNNLPLLTVLLDEFSCWLFSTSSSLFWAHSEKDGISSVLSSMFFSTSWFNVGVSTVSFILTEIFLVILGGMSSVESITLFPISFMLVTSKEISKDLSMSLAELEVSGVKRNGEALESLIL